MSAKAVPDAVNFEVCFTQLISLKTVVHILSGKANIARVGNSLVVRPGWIPKTGTCSFAPVHGEHGQVLPRVVLKDLVLHGALPIPFSGSKAVDENNNMVEDTASPVQVEVGLDLLGHLRKVDVVLKPTPIELFAPCVRAPNTLPQNGVNPTSLQLRVFQLFWSFVTKISHPMLAEIL